MRIVLQRVKQASVQVDGRLQAAIGRGLLVLLGIEESDTSRDVQWLVSKLISLRIFADEEGRMNLDIRQLGGGVLVISQFTLYASTKKGNRPSFVKAAAPEHALPLYEQFIQETTALLEKPAQHGVFGADMQVSLINDGPVTLILDSANKE